MKLLIALLICSCFALAISSSSKPDLVFVVDKSEAALIAIKNHAPDFFTELVNTEKTNNPIGNYIYVEFSVEDTDLYNSTYENAESLKSALTSREFNSLRGGNEPLCDGNSLTAINLGLELAAPKSVVIVVTDANPKDENVLADIKKKIESKQAKVIFVLMSAECPYPHSKEYQEIAHMSNGHISMAKQETVDKILKHIPASIGPERVDLLVANEEPKEEMPSKNFIIPLSDVFSHVLVIISSNSSFTSNVMDPTNKTITECERVENQAICKVEKPMNGNYTINLANLTSAYTVRVWATSKLMFHYGFQKNVTNVTRIFSHPIAGFNNTLLVKFHDPTLVSSLSSVEIIPVDGAESMTHYMLNATLTNETATLHNVTITHPDGTTTHHKEINNPAYGVYYTNFNLPESGINFKIIGKTANNNEFQVITPAVINAIPEDEKKENLAEGIEFIRQEEFAPKPVPMPVPPSKAEPEKAKGAASSSSFFMTSVALLFFVVKSICN